MLAPGSRDESGIRKLTPLSAAKQRRRNDDVWGTMGVEDLFLLVSLNISSTDLLLSIWDDSEPTKV